MLTFATGDVRRVTFDDGLDQLDGWSRDGKWLYFFSNGHDLSGGMNDVYRVAPEGGTPMAVSGDRYANEFFSASSPDGKTLAISARGSASGQWWRHGHSHLDEAEIWLRDLSVPDAPGAWRGADGRRRERPVADVGRRRPVAVLRVRSRRGGEHLADRHRGRAPRRDK